MNARTPATLAAQVAVPTDVIEFVRAARNDLSGTDYPGALDLLKFLSMKATKQGATSREIRYFSALYMLALEETDTETISYAQNRMLDWLDNYDLKA